jgi:hypothetical protein
MKKTALWVAAVAMTTAACAQKQDPLAVKYSKVITAEDAKRQLSIIAADDMEGRETGKPGAEKAANYLAGEYKKLGLLPANKGSYFLDIPLVAASFKVNSFMVNGTALTSGKDFIATGASPAKTVTASDVVFVGYGSAEELTTDITGKVVLYISAERPAKAGDPAPAAAPGGRRGGMSPARMKLVQNLQSKKPALLLAINPMMGGANGFGGRGFGGGGGRLAIKKEGPAVEVPVSYSIAPDLADQILKSSGKSFADLKTAIDGGTAQTQTVKAAISTSFASDDKDVKAVDIVAMIPGSDPKLKDEVLVFSAHYDHIGLNLRPDAKDKVNNGADDDGSGTTGILEIAGAFMQAKKDGHGPRRTILFLGNVGEEKGLLGSEYYTDHPVFPLANTITDLNIDMIGRVGTEYLTSADSGNYVYPIGSAMLSSALHKIGEDANNTYTHLKLDYKYDDISDPNRFYYRSDHYNFAKHGVPIIFYFNGVHADYHQPGDEVSKINFPLLAKRAQLVFFTGWELANRDKRPVVDGAAPPNQ